MENEQIQNPESENTNDKIIKINIEEQMKSCYIDYSMSVIVGRACAGCNANSPALR